MVDARRSIKFLLLQPSFMLASILPDKNSYYAKGKPWHFFVLGIVLSGYISLAYFRANENGRISMASIVPLLTLVPFSFFAFRGNYDRRPVLTISSKGIWFATW